MKVRLLSHSEYFIEFGGAGLVVETSMTFCRRLAHMATTAPALSSQSTGCAKKTMRCSLPSAAFAPAGFEETNREQRSAVATNVRWHRLVLRVVIRVIF